MLLAFSVTDVITIHEIRDIAICIQLHYHVVLSSILVCDRFVDATTPYLESFLHLLEIKMIPIFLLHFYCKVHTVPHEFAVMGSITVPTRDDKSEFSTGQCTFVRNVVCCCA